MTAILKLSEIKERLKTQFCDAVIIETEYIVVALDALHQIAEYLKNTPGLDFDFLDMITAADYPKHFDLIYRLLSLKNNLVISIKVSCDRENAEVLSLTGFWSGAQFQEREIYDLFGIVFSGHPGLHRIVLWEGYAGHPLRKDFKDRAYDISN